MLFRCKECGSTAKWTIQDLIDRGAPVCQECDEDMTIIKLDKLATIRKEAEELAMSVKERSDDRSLLNLADALLARINSK